MESPSNQPWGKDRFGKQEETLLEAPGKLFHSLYRTFTIATEFFFGLAHLSQRITLFNCFWFGAL